MASSGKESRERTIGRPGEWGSGAACPGGCGERAGARWGVLRVQLRSAPLFRRSGGGALGLVSCPGMGLILGPGDGRGGGGAGMEARLGAGVLEGSCWGGEEGWGGG